MMIRELSKEAIQGNRVILYGAGIDGKRILVGCSMAGVSVSFFCDEKLAGKKVQGISVIAPESLSKQTDEVVVIASGKYCDEIYRELQKRGVREDRIFSAIRMYRLGCKSNGLGTHDYESALRKYFTAMDGKIYLPSLDLVLTERCSLRCRDCSNLMQYYAQPKDCDSLVVMRSFQCLLQIVEGIGEVRILGGEPFLNQRLLQEVLKCYVDEVKVERFCIVTNGTVPVHADTLELLRHKKVHISCSNYETVYSRQKGWQSLQTSGIACSLMTDHDNWMDYGSLQHYDYTPAVYQKIYDGCTSRRYCNTLFQGRFYLCPRAAHGERLKAIPCCEADSVNILSEDQEKVRDQLTRLLERGTYIQACEYCDWLRGGLVPRAIQIQTPLSYEHL